MERKVFNLIILDASGSMRSIYNQAFNGVNETISMIKNAQLEHPELEQYLTLVSFSDDVNVIYKTTPINLVKHITVEDYPLLGCTALYDAMGKSITALQKTKSSTDAAIVTIITDGEENASRKWKGSQIKCLVEGLRETGWTFAYIGANQDVDAVADSIGIVNTLEFEASPMETEKMFHKLADCCEEYYDSIKFSGSGNTEFLGFFDKKPKKK